MRFSIITPSLNQLEYLRRCVASVRDQADGAPGGPRIGIEHLVMDGGSTDGTVAWLREQSPGGELAVDGAVTEESAADGAPYRLRWLSAPDRSMYEAVNRGLDRAAGELCAYLNTDEQYLPGALQAVAGEAENYPSAALFFGDALLVRPDGSLVSFRKGYALRAPYVMASHLYVLSCVQFMRRAVPGAGLRFDLQFRQRADQDFVVRLLRAGFRPRHVPRYLSAFTLTGRNMCYGGEATEEAGRLRARVPRVIRGTAPLLNLARYAEKWMAGAYRQRFPLDYALYTGDAAGPRTDLRATRATFHWPRGPETTP